jgi:dolichol-phosphate mannosyltransferase
MPVTPPVLSIVVPTYNEGQNVEALIERVRVAVDGIAWEIVFVDDDSPDGTADVVRAVAQRDGRVRCLQRIRRRGLSSACIEGMLATSAPFLAVMDADLQHDEALLPSMLEILREGRADIVVGSRYVADGDVGDWSPPRQIISRVAIWLSRVVTKIEIRDPMSGFFMVRRDYLHEVVRDLAALGFKILLDLLTARDRPPRIVELPYNFRQRQTGESKLDSRALWDYGMLLIHKLVGGLVPPRLVAFALIGSLGVGVHFAVLALLFRGLSWGFVRSHIVATVTAMTFNYSVNNLLTYYDVKLRGLPWLYGLFTFVLACSVGAVANVGVAAFLFREQATGWPLAAAAGILIGLVWNYSVTAFYTWRQT